MIEGENEEYCCEMCGNMFNKKSVVLWDGKVVCWFCLDDMNQYFGVAF